MNTMSSGYVSGIHEFIVGCGAEMRSNVEAYWKIFGFERVSEGTIDAGTAQRLYGHTSDATTLRLAHSGCKDAVGGYIKLICWERLKDQGLGNCTPSAPGSRWLGLYTEDVLRIADACEDSKKKYGSDWWISPLVRAALEWPEPVVDLVTSFVGLRELVVLNDYCRHAFIQRVGFDRPGFGTIDRSLKYRNSEGTHANLVQAAGDFNSAFYKDTLGWVTAPYGDAEDVGDKPATKAVLGLTSGEMLRMERLKSPYSDSGMLQIYAPLMPRHEPRFNSTNPGSRGLTGFSVTATRPDLIVERAIENGAVLLAAPEKDEEGLQRSGFIAPDGFYWSVVARESEA